jgi:ethanolamine utilization protein EutN
MQLGRVIGNATATVRHPSMQGWKLLVVQPLASDGQSPDGDPILAVDNQGAGWGEQIIITSDGRAARQLLNNENTPVRWSVVGIPD